MTEAQKILHIIEGAHPNDKDTLNEIDARVWFFLNDAEFIKANDFNGRVYGYTARQKSIDQRYSDLMEIGGQSGFTAPQYTRSRDALKAIRPEGWQVKIAHDAGSNVWQCSLTKWAPRSVPLKCINYHWNYAALTEELAELHAIIQAIEWERSQ